MAKRARRPARTHRPPQASAADLGERWGVGSLAMMRVRSLPPSRLRPGRWDPGLFVVDSGIGRSRRFTLPPSGQDRLSDRAACIGFASTTVLRESDPDKPNFTLRARSRPARPRRIHGTPRPASRPSPRVVRESVIGAAPSRRRRCGRVPARSSDRPRTAGGSSTGRRR